MALELVEIKEGDLGKIINWRSKSEVTKYMYTDPVLTLDKQLKWYKNIMKDMKVKYWMIKFDGTKIGVINLYNIDNINNRCSWAYYIGNTSYRGKGIGTLLECNVYDYVFDVLNFNKLCCEVFTFNEKVIQIHQKFGSEIEGELKQHILKNGKYYDIVAMAITKEKWKKIKDNYSYKKIYIE